MPDGSALRLGRQDNTATLRTSLARTGSNGDIALFVENEFGNGIFGQGRGPDPFPGSPRTTGVRGDSDNGPGVWGSSSHNVGVYGQSSEDVGIWGHGFVGMGVYGSSSGHAMGVQGIGSIGVFGAGNSDDDAGVHGSSRHSTGVIGHSNTGLAGLFSGDVHVSGSISASGNKPFRIDHPLDPANKYLNHVSVESPQMKNVYDGVAQLDEEGVAWVQLPGYFQALNRDFRYQLSAIGASAPQLHIAEEVSENRFKIAGGQAGMKVSWQLTGIRKDKWAEANPLEVEQAKGVEERGRYLQPELYGDETDDRGIHQPIPGDRVQELLRQAEELRRQAEEHRSRMEEKRRQVEEQRPPRTEGQ
jgi:hypothetical protein